MFTPCITDIGPNCLHFSRSQLQNGSFLTTRDMKIEDALLIIYSLILELWRKECDLYIKRVRREAKIFTFFVAFARYFEPRMEDSFQRKLDSNRARLIDSYRTILKKASIQDSTNVQDDLAVQTASAAIVSTFLQEPLTATYSHNNITSTSFDFPTVGFPCAISPRSNPWAAGESNFKAKRNRKNQIVKTKGNFLFPWWLAVRSL
jgi:hypothetical protein